MQQDMEHNAYNHHLDFNREQTVGIVAYLLFDVKQPSPSLFLSDPAAYTAQVQHAGMRAALAGWLFTKLATARPAPFARPSRYT